MIKFLDRTSKSWFDSSQVHWTPTISTGLYGSYSLAICNEGDEPVEVSLEDIPVDANYDLRFWDPQSTETDLMKATNRNPVTIDKGTTGIVYIVAYFEVPGEYITGLKVGSEVLHLGIPVEGENEILTTNLVNRGVELPQDIYRALEVADPTTDRPDWVVLNNHLKELLINYMEVLGNKGSYASLINSLAWFGYGDSVRLREWWSYETPAGTKMFDAAVVQVIRPHIEEYLFNSHKTTHLALFHMWEVDKTLSGWDYSEMCLKMVLLGHFFETYFMPVHTDLLISAVVETFNVSPFYLSVSASELVSTNEPAPNDKLAKSDQ